MVVMSTNEVLEKYRSGEHIYSLGYKYILEQRDRVKFFNSYPKDTPDNKGVLKVRTSTNMDSKGLYTYKFIKETI